MALISIQMAVASPGGRPSVPVADPEVTPPWINNCTLSALPRAEPADHGGATDAKALITRGGTALSELMSWMIRNDV